MLPCIPHVTVPDLLNHVCDQFAQRPCLAMYGAATQTYAQLHASVRRMAGQLKALGVASQSRVLIMLENSPQVIHTWLAVNFINAIDVGINTGYRGQTLEHAVSLSEARLMVTFSHYLEVIAASAHKLGNLQTLLVLDVDGGAGARAGDASPAIAQLEEAGIRVVPVNDLPGDAACPGAAVAPADIASVIFTSGTTGSAKGVQMPHAQVCLLAQRSAQKTGLTQDDTFYSFYPMYHMAGKFMSVLATFSVGGKVVMDTSFRPECWLSRIRETGATATAAHGPMLEMVFAQPPASDDRDHALRVVRTA
ncbi:MAG TPA: AMP-binding protein, partial [Advenella sp.]|nr:AMP-binding protein [Advenella sp.]